MQEKYKSYGVFIEISICVFAQVCK